MVMTEEPASERLLTASSVMAIEPVMVPIAALKAASRTFATMPTMLVRTMAASRPAVAVSGLALGDVFVSFTSFRELVSVASAMMRPPCEVIFGL